MILEEDYESIQYKNDLFYIIKKDKAVIYLSINSNYAVVLNNLNEIVGINVGSNENVYSPSKLIPYLKEKIDEKSYFISKVKGIEIVEWWNQQIVNKKIEEKTLFHSIKIKKEDLEKYFTSTKSEESTTYYVNPPIPDVSVEISNDITISYDYVNIQEITIIEDNSTKEKLIYFNNDEGRLEDIDISTTKDWDEIHFIFDKGDLECSSTNNNEHQLYVELCDKISPYNSVEENDKILMDFLNKRRLDLN